MDETAPRVKMLYETAATASGGRQGHVATADGKLALDLSIPRGLGGADGPGTNPEQLFALGYAACVHSVALCTARQRRAEVGTRSQETCPPPNRVPRRAVRLPWGILCLPEGPPFRCWGALRRTRCLVAEPGIHGAAARASPPGNPLRPHLTIGYAADIAL